MYVNLNRGSEEDLNQVLEMIQNSNYSLSITDRLRSWWFDQESLPKWMIVDTESMSVEFTAQSPRKNKHLVAEISDVVEHGIEGAHQVVQYINGEDNTFDVTDGGEIKVLRPINTNESFNLERMKGLVRAAEVRQGL